MQQRSLQNFHPRGGAGREDMADAETARKNGAEKFADGVKWLIFSAGSSSGKTMAENGRKKRPRRPMKTPLQPAQKGIVGK